MPLWPGPQASRQQPDRSRRESAAPPLVQLADKARWAPQPVASTRLTVARQLLQAQVEQSALRLSPARQPEALPTSALVPFAPPTWQPAATNLARRRQE